MIFLAYYVEDNLAHTISPSDSILFVFPNDVSISTPFFSVKWIKSEYTVMNASTQFHNRLYSVNGVPSFYLFIILL